MISALNFTSVLGDSITFGVGTTVAPYPVNYWDTSIEMRGQSRPKMQTPGNWPHNQVPGEMTIEIHGAILGEDIDDFVTNRRAIMKAMYPFGPLIPINTIIGTLSVTIEGDSSAMVADVGFNSFSRAYDTTAGDYAYNRFQIIWTSFDPWFNNGIGDIEFI